MKHRNKLLYLCNGNAEAVDFIEGFWAFMELYDDLIDRDKPVEDEHVHNALLWALFGLQDNGFYRANRIVLRVAMLQAIAAWRKANEFQAATDRALIEQAYFMRCSAYDVFSTVALLAGGFARQLEAVEYFRSLAADDSLDAFVREHTAGET